MKIFEWFRWSRYGMCHLNVMIKWCHHITNSNNSIERSQFKWRSKGIERIKKSKKKGRRFFWSTTTSTSHHILFVELRIKNWIERIAKEGFNWELRIENLNITLDTVNGFISIRSIDSLSIQMFSNQMVPSVNWNTWFNSKSKLKIHKFKIES